MTVAFGIALWVASGLLGMWLIVRKEGVLYGLDLLIAIFFGPFVLFLAIVLYSLDKELWRRKP